MTMVPARQGFEMTTTVSAAGRLKLRVENKRLCAEGIAAFELVAADGGALPPFTAGAHVDVFLPNGLIRQYSLRNDPRERHRYCLGVLRETAGRGGSACMHDLVKAGDVLETSLPRNAFALDETAPFSLLLAGGIGVTPILAMAHRLTTLGRPFAFHYGARSEARMAFRDEVEAAFAGNVHLHFDDGPAEQRLDLAALLAARPAGAHLYACGPAGFLAAAMAAVQKAWPAEAVHREYFADAPAVDASGDKAFTVRLGDGRTFSVAPGRSVVEVLGENGIVVPTSCEQGICGTCVTRVIAGKPDHRDLVLTDKERAAGCFTPCCSRSLTEELVLDI